MLQNVEVICKRLVEWRMLKQSSVCQTPEIETDELFLWTSTTAPAGKAEPLCQGSLVGTVDCKSAFSLWTNSTQKIHLKRSYGPLIPGTKTIILGCWGCVVMETNCLHVLNKGTFFMRSTCCSHCFLPFLDESEMFPNEITPISTALVNNGKDM